MQIYEDVLDGPLVFSIICALALYSNYVVQVEMAHCKLETSNKQNMFANLGMMAWFCVAIFDLQHLQFELFCILFHSLVTNY